jgi:hypothetical protein
VTVRVYINGRGVDAPDQGTALDAVRAFDAVLAERIAAGERALTDSRGLPVAATSPAFDGAIYRVVANRGGESAGG